MEALPVFPLLAKIEATNHTTAAPNLPVLWPGSAASGLLGQAVGFRSLSKYVPCQKQGLRGRLPARVLDSSSCPAVPPASVMVPTHFWLWELWAENQEPGEG